MNKITLTGAAFALGLGAAVLTQASAFAEERDPTRPGAMAGMSSGSGVSNTGSLTLQAIFFTTDNRQAVINNQVVAEGDILAGSTIEQINANTVVLRASGASNASQTVLQLSSPTPVKRSTFEEF
ncbi:general secretion pathway protein GspB [Alteromonas sp. ASW11-19]|uniref:General secretion pathway protein GspB n=1 Tax=Alteromonas salexigens TaxID=2982530 RepID=A0ABT2VN19_9ALTE|nr:general secretion pathway protein GspB [Alteromonas salexigens]MCU7554697.1 general secretion pathway protein GspB [Alteromonas salexigens]